MFSSDGWDPWLEESASLWLLHWLMLRPPCLLPVWWAALNEFQAIEFSDDDLTEFCSAVVRNVDDWGSSHRVPSRRMWTACVAHTRPLRSGKHWTTDLIARFVSWAC